MWLVYIKEPGQGYMWWRADIDSGVWVSEPGRATRYPARTAALAVADQLADDTEDAGDPLAPRVIAEADIC